MKDFLGHNIYPGDRVIFIYSGGSGHRLMTGEVETVKGGLAYIKGMKYGCYAGDDPREVSDWGRPVKVKSQSIFKVPKDLTMTIPIKSELEVIDDNDLSDRKLCF